MGRLPWFAFFFRRSLRLRPLVLMVSSVLPAIAGQLALPVKNTRATLVSRTGDVITSTQSLTRVAPTDSAAHPERFGRASTPAPRGTFTFWLRVVRRSRRCRTVIQHDAQPRRWGRTRSRNLKRRGLVCLRQPSDDPHLRNNSCPQVGRRRRCAASPQHRPQISPLRCFRVADRTVARGLRIRPALIKTGVHQVTSKPRPAAWLRKDFRRFSRPRWRRLVTVPIGISRISATSL